MKLLLEVREKNPNRTWRSGSEVPDETKRLLVREIDWPVVPDRSECCVLGRDEANTRNITSRVWAGEKFGEVFHNFMEGYIKVTFSPIKTEEFEALMKSDDWHFLEED